ncbi:glycine--tRNA ligase subunit beta [Thermithiobacillus plumbiphilus]|uniref:Glycine--tRNA ligase beta subunit n=1 Tax=Thermithiobacillus plumbiphilus TaxID=1729899 RepID=A0ABU9DBS6_9PROT
MTHHDLILEIGCEEIPAKDQQLLAQALADGLLAALDEAQISAGECQRFASPRRIAVLLRHVAGEQATREVIKRGPALERAFDADGKPTPATQGFARSNKVEVTQLERMTLDKGEFLVYRQVEAGRPTAEVLLELIPQVINRLPLRKRMRWGSSQASFVRPVQWMLARLGGVTLPLHCFELQAGDLSQGHRVMHPQALRIAEPAHYADCLLAGKVMADFRARRQYIDDAVRRLASELDGLALMPDALLDEVTGLVEWPVVLAGAFEEGYLAIPPEVLTTVMMQHQRYFPLRRPGSDKALLNRFIFVANLESRDPAAVIHGNSRVLRARLADAEFFWNEDRKRTLASRRPELEQVLFQRGLGSLLAKSGRLVRLAPVLANAVQADAQAVQRAAELCKCDLLTGMVSEFPELQGIMGGYYAAHDGETSEVSSAISGHYAPAGRGDAIPLDPGAQALSLADKLDTLAGFFGLGQIPTGDKDPFALRRAALGILRILLEGNVPLDLPQAIGVAASAYGPAFGDKHPGFADQLLDFFLERQRVFFREEGFSADLVEAVLSLRPADPLDARNRLEALSRFRQRPEAEALAAANKRIGNILRKEAIEHTGAVQERLLLAPAEIELWREWQALQPPVADLMQQADYGAALDLLAALRAPVDRFFDEVMVMDEDPQVRANRLALIGTLRNAFLQVADFSLMQGR